MKQTLPFHLLITCFFASAQAAQDYRPFTIKDGIVAGYHIAAGAFNMAAYGTGMGTNFQDPKVARYAELVKSCQESANAWNTKSNLLLNPLLNIDLKDPKQVAALGVGTSIAAIMFVKLVSGGIDAALSWKRSPKK